MAQVTRAMRFFRKAEAALLAAIELYNKPDFRYREEAFAVLALNAWELLLKAKLLAESKNDPRSLYLYGSRQTKKGVPSTKLYARRNRTGNYHTIGIGKVVAVLEDAKGVKLSPLNQEGFLQPKYHCGVRQALHEKELMNAHPASSTIRPICGTMVASPCHSQTSQRNTPKIP